MDTLGAKVRVFGDAVYEQDSPWPQVAVGLQYKKNTDMAIPTAVGAKKGSDTDFYVAATKVWLGGLRGPQRAAEPHAARARAPTSSGCWALAATGRIRAACSPRSRRRSC